MRGGFIVVAFALSLNICAQGLTRHTYYVSGNGNDRNTGTLKNPFRTIQRAVDVMRGGDVCYVRQGVYREAIRFRFDGSLQSPIRISNYRKDTVVITGNKPVTNWEPYKGNIYKAFWPDSVTQVFCNHMESPIASYPDISDKLSSREWADVYADSAGRVVFKGRQFPLNYWAGAYCRLLTGKKWIAHIGKVVSGSDSTVNCVNESAPFRKLNAGVYLGEGKACITGHLNALDHDHEWVWKNDTLYYYVPAGQDIAALSIEVRGKDDAIHIAGRRYVELSGLHFFAVSLDLRNAEHCRVEQGSVQYPTTYRWYGSGWQYNQDTDPQTAGNEDAERPGMGVCISGKSNVIQQEYIAHSWGDGITLGGVSNTVDNCLIEDCDWSFTDCAAINATGYKLRVINNTCRTTARSILVHRLAGKIKILHNHLYNAGLATDDLGVTYAFHTNGDSAEIAYNWIHDNKATGTATGIYLDNEDTAFVVHHNVVWNCGIGIQTNKNAVDHEIYNNTIFNCQHPSWAWGPAGTVVAGQKVYNNLSESPFLVGNDLRNNIVEQKVMMEDAGQYDFRPTGKSKAIDAGIVIEGISETFTGKAPDAGAYEFGGEAWKAGSNTRPVGDIFPALPLARPLPARGIVNVADYGAIPDAFSDAVPALQRAIKACHEGKGNTLYFPRGRYDFWPENAASRNYFISNTSSETECPSKWKVVALLFEDIGNLTIDGNGSLFVFHGKMITFAMTGCHHITMKNIEVDFERPTMSEMTFDSVSAHEILANISPDSRFAILNGKLNWYGEGWGMKAYHAILIRPDSTAVYSSWAPFLKSEAEMLGCNRVRFRGDFVKYAFHPGETLTIRDPTRDCVGAFINHSQNITLKNVAMHYMHGLGIVNQFSENLHFDSVFIRPRPESGRKIAAFADCIHFSGCKGQILIEHCQFAGAHDDPINVHGTHLQVTEILAPTVVKLRFMHAQTYGFAAFFAGDTVAFVHSAKLQRFGYGIVRSAKLVSEREMLVELLKPLPQGLVTGDCFENVTWTPSLTVRNCQFERTNTRGLLVTTGRKVLIEDNVFFRTGMHAILIADDASSWYESGPVGDVLIRDNSFEECGYNSAPGNYVIAIAPENHVLVDGYYVHRNIRIEHNVFKVYDMPLLTARSTDSLVFSNNTILQSHFLPAGANRNSFTLTACKDISIRNNTFNTDWKPSIRLIHTMDVELNTDLPIMADPAGH